MSKPIGGKIDRYYENLQNERQKEEAKGKPLVSGDVVEFCEKQLGFKPFAYQEKFLRDQSQFVVARWSRQSGKSTTIAALTLYLVLSQSNRGVVILAPSWRQSIRLINKITLFLSKLDRVVVEGRSLKTKLVFVNGSWIEALPNNPDTIRGSTCDMILGDELNFVLHDEDLYDSIIYSLGTTNGRFIGASTPGSRDSLFYEMCTNDEKFGDVSRHHVTWKEAMEPNGPLKKEILEKIRNQMIDEPWRWQREMEAEFAVDEDAFFTYALITRCVDPELEYFGDEDLLREIEN